MKVRIIGDVHGKVDQYLDLLRDQDYGLRDSYSLQLGDMGFRKQYARLFVDPARHVFIPGNHDQYDALPPQALGDFGVDPLGIPESFYVRGAYSIDQAYRIIGVSWWEEEELTVAQSDACFAAYCQARPRRMFTHDAPMSLVTRVTSMPNLRIPASRTQLLLQTLWEEHQPEEWTFGHYHRSVTLTENGTRFQCLNELEYVDQEF